MMPAPVIGAVPPAMGQGVKTQRDVVRRGEDQLVDRLERADQLRQRLAIVDVGGPLLQRGLPARLGHRDRMDLADSSCRRTRRRSACGRWGTSRQTRRAHRGRSARRRRCPATRRSRYSAAHRQAGHHGHVDLGDGRRSRVSGSMKCVQVGPGPKCARPGPMWMSCLGLPSRAHSVKLRGALAQRLLHHVRWQAHPLAVHPRAGLFRIPRSSSCRRRGRYTEAGGRRR